MKARRVRRWSVGTVIAVAIVLLGTALSGNAADPDALWKIDSLYVGVPRLRCGDIVTNLSTKGAPNPIRMNTCERL